MTLDVLYAIEDIIFYIGYIFVNLHILQSIQNSNMRQMISDNEVDILFIDNIRFYN